MTTSEEHVVKHAPAKKHRRFGLKPSSPRSWRIVILVVALVIGYVGGTYNPQIMAAIGPLFGYKAHSATIDLSSVQATYNQLAANFDGTLNTQALIDGANHGLVAAANDTYTVYMDKKEANAFNNDLSGNIGGGIGAEISMVNSKLTITRLLDGNPAVKAGLMVNDVITAINDQATTGLTVDQAVTQIRGDVGTTVKISVLRGTDAMDFTITRATITDPSVISSVANGVGTITISRFDQETGDLATTAAQSFKKQGVKAVILDLRDNGGGYLTAAQAVAGLWLNNKTVVTEQTNGHVVDTVKSGDNPILAGLPTVVLVNGESASASEIVAGALQDYGVAKLVGEKTFGKGSVQKVIPLADDSQLKVTIAKWYTPKGKNINKEGITPDITATLTQANVDAGVDPQVDAAMKALNL